MSQYLKVDLSLHVYIYKTHLIYVQLTYYMHSQINYTHTTHMHSTRTLISPVSVTLPIAARAGLFLSDATDVESRLLAENTDRKNVCSDVLPPLSRLDL